MWYLVFILLVILSIYYYGLRSKFINVWIIGYYRKKLKDKFESKSTGPKHILFCFVDHYEPYQGGATKEVADKRVKKWSDLYPEYASKYSDSTGVHPQHTFFYPEEEYDVELLDQISVLCQNGFGETEIHLHHDNDTEQGFIDKINSFKTVLYDKHQLLYKVNGEIVFSFIHGNWALDNSGKDGKWCGINNEITLLKELGCYADCTMPSGPNECQTSTVNSIYYSIDDPCKPKSHDKGILVSTASQPVSSDLMIIQGPISLSWKYRKLGIWPRIEYGDITPIDAIPIKNRIDMWVNENVHVTGCPEWVSVKVHTHGAIELNSEYLFEQGGFDDIHQYLENTYNDGVNYVLHYVTVRELYNIIKAAEDGNSGNPADYKNYIIKK